MVLTVADVQRWNAGAVRDVFHAATARGNATLEASRQLSTLSVFDSWDGLTAEARKHTNATIRQDLDAHGQESLAVAQAAGKAADDIEKVQSELRTLQHDASELHMTIDPASNKIVPAEKMPPMEAEIAEMQLQPRLDKVLAEADTVDAELAAAINMAEGNVPTGPPSAPINKQNADSAVPPELAQLQRSNDQAVVDAVAKAQAAQKALADAQSAAAVATYTHGPGSQEADAANAVVTARRADLADALAKVDQIPDYSGVDPKSVTAGQGGIAFLYNANGQQVQVGGTLKNGTGEIFDQGRLAYYTYKDGKLVGTRFLDPGQAQAVEEPLLTATTAGVPLVKGLKGGWIGLRALLATQGGDAVAGAGLDEGMSHATALAAERASAATSHLAVTGPGVWQSVTESMSQRAAAYQMQITGHPITEGYLVNGVKFDGFADGALTDSKGYYAQFIDHGAWKPWFSGDQSLIAQAQRQISVAAGTPIHWVFAEPESAALVEQMLQSRGIAGIDCIVVPPK
jgi:hypothetical protein